MDKYLCDWGGADCALLLEIEAVSVCGVFTRDGGGRYSRIRWGMAGVYDREWDAVLGL